MALVPAGKRRMMVAQAAPSPMAEQAGEMSLPEGMTAQDLPTAGNEVDQLQRQVDQAEPQQEEPADENDTRTTIFEFLVGLGYPPRRLQEFKSQFVSETGSAGAGTQVTVKLPDEVYGKNVQIPREKIKELVQAIEQKHGLSFRDYKRSNEELVLNFISADAAQQQAMEDAGPGDILDKVYKSKGARSREAMTIQELIKESKDRQAHILKLVVGAK
jgi:hypothetical protein